MSEPFFWSAALMLTYTAGGALFEMQSIRGSVCRRLQTPEQCFSTGVPRVAARGSAETGRNSPKPTEIAWDEIRKHLSVRL